MSKTAIVTGAGGLVGSAAVEKLIAEGYTVLGFENNMRRYFFGEDGSTQETLGRLKRKYMTKGQFIPQAVDIRDYPKILDWVKAVGGDLDIVIHAAAQPSHDWAAREPHTDFSVNALGTLNVLEAVRNVNKDATVCCISTSKVYGDRPNSLMLTEHKDRFDLPEDHPWHKGITPDMSIDQCLHSLFGASKVSGDIIAQEYGRYFQMNTLILRPGCITGPAHAGVPLHGFLSYLMKCALSETEYTIIGYHGKQVRCNIHADDLVDACLAYHKAPHAYGAVYNIGGGRESACSVLEAIAAIEEITGRQLRHTYEPTPRIGDHIWWISDIAQLQADYPEWKPRDLYTTLRQMYAEMTENGHDLKKAA
jgi:CDP-paratose 2-epimerase